MGLSRSFGMHDPPDQQPGRIGDDLALASLDRLAGGMTSGGYAFAGSDALAVDHTCGRGGRVSFGLPRHRDDTTD